MVTRLCASHPLMHKSDILHIDTAEIPQHGSVKSLFPIFGKFSTSFGVSIPSFDRSIWVVSILGRMETQRQNV